jgi:hypothetical protein
MDLTEAALAPRTGVPQVGVMGIGGKACGVPTQILARFQAWVG